VTEWGKCSKSCGGGNKTRELYCSKIDGTATRIVTASTECVDDQPEVDLVASCNAIICPAFYEYGDWSQVSHHTKLFFYVHVIFAMIQIISHLAQDARTTFYKDFKRSQIFNIF